MVVVVQVPEVGSPSPWQRGSFASSQIMMGGGVVFVGQSVQRIHVIQNVADPILVPRADGGVRVELVVVLFLKPIDILIHAAVLGPIIYEGNDQFDSQLAGAVHGIIDVRQAGGGAIVVSRGTPVPVLQVKSVA